ncbi:MAG: hypothetical protein QM749_03840 [Aquabacterium sp.]
MEIYKETEYGSLKIQDVSFNSPQSWVGAQYLVQSTVVSQPNFIFKGQPTGTSRLAMSYRSKTGDGTWTTKVLLPLQIDGKVVPGQFVANDWTGVTRGDYEVRYLALDVDGNVLNSQSGDMKLSDTAPTFTPTTIASNAVGEDLRGH